MAFDERSWPIGGVIREKDGIRVYRTTFDGQPAVAKVFDRAGDRREIGNYRLLAWLGVPTPRVLGWGEDYIILEDIDQSPRWRLGTPEDLNDPQVAGLLARWYFLLHRQGLNAPGLQTLYSEMDALTEPILEALALRLPEAAAAFAYLKNHLDTLLSWAGALEPTHNYNDFYWTNLIVGRERQEAAMLDYNLLGRGTRTNDLMNVLSSLSPRAGEAFLTHYDRLYMNEYGHGRDPLEQRVYSVTSCVFTLDAAFRRDEFPRWALAEREKAAGGRLLQAARELLEE